MTDYTPITDTQLDPDAPLTSALAYAWRDNPIAMFEGALGAPRLEIPALGDLSAGATNRAGDPSVKTITSPGTGNPDVRRVDVVWGFMQAGVVRVTFDHDGAATTNSRILRISNSGVETVVQTWAGAGGWTTRTLDVTFGRGEVLKIDHVAVGTSSSSIRNITIGTGGEWLWPGVGCSGVYLL